MNLLSDTVLFQHGFTNTDYYWFIGLTARHHIMYCRHWGIDYRLILGDVVGDNRDGGHWAKVAMFIELLDMGYKNVIYLDGDTLIVDWNTDLRTAIVPEKVGAVWHNSMAGDRDVSHYNAGAFYADNTPLIRQFMREWLAGYPGQTMPHFPLVREQGVFREVGDRLGVIAHLDNKWNAESGVAPSEHPVVMGYHGFRNATYECMKATLAGLDKPYERDQV